MAQATQSQLKPNGTAPKVNIESIQEALDLLNERAQAAELTPFKFGIADPHEFIPAPLNAHFMRDETFRQLVENICKDGNLASFPLCYHENDKVFMIDGHHRVEAAKKAEVSYMFYLYLDRSMDDDERIARQLAANAIVGQDDDQKLLALYSQIASIDMKMYSGLDEQRFKTFQPVNLKMYADKALTFKTIELAFMPNEVEHIIEKLDGIGKSSRVRFIGTLEQYEPMIQAFMRLKKATNVHNTAAAFMVMIECTHLYCEWLETVQEMDSADWLALHEELARRSLAETLVGGETSLGQHGDGTKEKHATQQ